MDRIWVDVDAKKGSKLIPNRSQNGSQMKPENNRKTKIGSGSVLRRGPVEIPGRSRGGDRGSHTSFPLEVWIGFGFVIVLVLHALRLRKLVASADFL